MRQTLSIIFFISIILISCNQTTNKYEKQKSTDSLNTIDTLVTKTNNQNKINSIAIQDNSDSLLLDKLLNEALKFSTQNINKNKFYKKIEAITDSGFIVKVEISLDNYFTKFYPHLIIHRRGPDAVYIDIYSKNDNKFENVLTHEQWTMEYMNDTIRDINGDGLNDFVVNWYGSNGCCLKAFSNIYLLRPDKKTFTNNLEFINPTFSPTEKIIRGVCYGHPGETEMYKYKWNGETIDTIEYISYEKNKNGEKTGKILITKKRPYDYNEKIQKRLTSIPNEYKKIDGYDWFTGKGDE